MNDSKIFTRFFQTNMQRGFYNLPETWHHKPSLLSDILPEQAEAGNAPLHKQNRRKNRYYQDRH